MIRDTDYEYIRKLVYERSRINLGADKRELVTARLNKRLQANKIASISEYCRFLQTQSDEEELCHLIDVISTNHTYFFREKDHFDFLYKVAMPEMMARRDKERWSHFSIWSAASSSGEEPYTLAITIAEFMRVNKCTWPWRVEATDISHRILQKARIGQYNQMPA